MNIWTFKVDDDDEDDDELILHSGTGTQNTEILSAILALLTCPPIYSFCIVMESPPIPTDDIVPLSDVDGLFQTLTMHKLTKSQQQKGLV